MPKHILTAEQLAALKPLYEAGLSCYKIAQIFSVHDETIRHALRKQGVERRDLSARHRTHRCNHRYFQTIDTEPKAYWLGFLAADGCVLEHPYNRISIVLHRKDHEHLVRFTEALESSHPIKQMSRSNSGYGDNSTQSRIDVRSPEMVADLISHGITPKKTFTLQWPDLPDEMLRHFLRGYFDGDGTMSAKDYQKGRGLHIKWSIISSIPFCQGCRSYLMRTCALNETKLYNRARCPKIADLSYMGSFQVARIAELMYRGATVFLQRKYDKIAPYLNDQPGLFDEPL